MSLDMLCENCLNRGAEPMSYGPELGSQYDPYHAVMKLCTECRFAWEAHDLKLFHDMWQDHRTVTHTNPKVK